MIKKAMAALLISLMAGCGSDAAVQGHVLRVFAVENQDASWITQDDIGSAERTTDNSQAVLRLHLKPEAQQRVFNLTSANIGKMVRFTWDGKVVADLKVAGAFGRVVDLPAPPT